MKKKHIIWFTGDERKIRDDMMDKLKATSQKPRRGRILRPVDADGPNWTDRQVAVDLRRRTRTVEHLRGRYALGEVRSSLNCAAGQSCPPWNQPLSRSRSLTPLVLVPRRSTRFTREWAALAHW